jgi:hypothetical protein
MATTALLRPEIKENDQDWKRLTADDLERIRLSGLDITEQYGESYKVFDWCYWIIASPVPSKKGSRIRRSRGNSDETIKEMLEDTFHELEIADWNLSSQTGQPALNGRGSRRLRYVYCLETGLGGWRHAHVLLGSISRLDPFHVEAAFKAHKFGYVLVRVWNERLESGYPFKSLAPSSSDHYEAHPDSNVTWNRKCKQEMKLHRKHLLRLVGPQATNERLPNQTTSR